MSDPLRNRAKVSFLFRENATNEMYVADFSDLKFTKIADPWGKPENPHDHVAVCADLLHVAADQILYAAGLNGLCKTSENERDALKAHIASLERLNDRIMSQIEAKSEAKSDE